MDFHWSTFVEQKISHILDKITITENFLVTSARLSV